MKRQLITLVVLILGFVLGATALTAVAESWAPPSAPPPDSNVPAPINVGSIFQRKDGKFALGSLNSYSSETNRPLLDVKGSAIINSLGIIGTESSTDLIVRGGTPAAGKVLKAADSNGLVTWGDDISSGVSISKTGVVKASAATNGVFQVIGSTSTYDVCFLSGMQVFSSEENSLDQCRITRQDGNWGITPQSTAHVDEGPTCYYMCF